MLKMTHKSCIDFSFFSDTEDGFPGFDIGIFQSCEEAERVALRYRQEVPGFKDYDCDYSILGIPVWNDEVIEESLYFSGLELDEQGDEIDYQRFNLYSVKQKNTLHRHRNRFLDRNGC